MNFECKSVQFSNPTSVILTAPLNTNLIVLENDARGHDARGQVSDIRLTLLKDLE